VPIGAGTFGAKAGEKVEDIPWQYNLIIFDPNKGDMIVKTRKKEKEYDTWWADARWGDKNDPKPKYSFTVKDRQSSNSTGR
jgi:hypothetical protein